MVFTNHMPFYEPGNGTDGRLIVGDILCLQLPESGEERMLAGYNVYDSSDFGTSEELPWMTVRLQSSLRAPLEESLFNQISKLFGDEGKVRNDVVQLLDGYLDSIEETLKIFAENYCFVSITDAERRRTDAEAKIFLRGKQLPGRQKAHYQKFYRGQIRINQEEQ